MGDTRAAPLLGNLEALFAANAPHQLVVWPWMPRDEFLGVLRTMHVVSQQSMSETFCCIAADAVSVGVPLLASREVPFTDLASLRALMATHEQAWRDFLEAA